MDVPSLFLKMSLTECWPKSVGGLGRDHIKKQMKGVGEEDRGLETMENAPLYKSQRSSENLFCGEISLEAGEQMTAEI